MRTVFSSLRSTQASRKTQSKRWHACKNTLGHKKQTNKQTKPCLTGGQTCQVGSVFLFVSFFLFHCFFLEAKMTLKTRILKKKKSDIFRRKILGKYFDLFFKNFHQNF